jgi:hypothetical protein
MTARPVIRTSTTAAPQVPSEAEELAREKQQAADLSRSLSREERGRVRGTNTRVLSLIVG